MPYGVNGDKRVNKDGRSFSVSLHCSHFFLSLTEVDKRKVKLCIFEEKKQFAVTSHSVYFAIAKIIITSLRALFLCPVTYFKSPPCPY